MQRLKKIIIQTSLLVLGGIVFGFCVNALSSDPLSLTYQPRVKKEAWPVVTSAQVQQYLQDGTALFIDARDPEEYEKGHIPNALNLPAEQFGEYFMQIGDSLPREDLPLIVYCQGDPCDQSHEVLEHLKDLEFKNLLLYTGGWNEWSRYEQ